MKKGRRTVWMQSGGCCFWGGSIKKVPLQAMWHLVPFAT